MRRHRPGPSISRVSRTEGTTLKCSLAHRSRLDYRSTYHQQPVDIQENIQAQILVEPTQRVIAAGLKNIDITDRGTGSRR